MNSDIDDKFGFEKIKKETNTINQSLFTLFPTPVYTVQLNPDDYLQEESVLKNYFIKTTSEKVEFKGSFVRTSYQNPCYLNFSEVKKLANVFEKYNELFFLNVMGYTGGTKISSSWINVLKHDEYIPQHTHSNSIISGCYYFDVPDDSSIIFHKKINFSSPYYEYIPTQMSKNINLEFANQDFKINVKRGLLIIFPSNLAHSVERNQNKKDRWSLAYNVTNKNPQIF